MPCNTVRFVELELKNPDPEVVLAALMRLGFKDARMIASPQGQVASWGNQTYHLRSGQFRQGQLDQQTFQKAYSRELTMRSAQKAGWKANINQKNQWKLQLVRR